MLGRLQGLAIWRWLAPPYGAIRIVEEGAWLVAQVAGRRAGRVRFDPVAPEGHRKIVSLFVLRWRRRRGVGRALIDAAVEHARRAGAEAVYAHVHEGHRVSLRTFERAGFQRVEPIRDGSPTDRPGFVTVRVRIASAR